MNYTKKNFHKKGDIIAVVDRSAAILLTDENESGKASCLMLASGFVTTLDVSANRKIGEATFWESVELPGIPQI
jgi:hypothetical protein